jgi:hypothetical protein
MGISALFPGRTVCNKHCDSVDVPLALQFILTTNVVFVLTKYTLSPQVLLRMDSVGICGSDVHYWTHGAIGTASRCSGPRRPLSVSSSYFGSYYTVHTC